MNKEREIDFLIEKYIFENEMDVEPRQFSTNEIHLLELIEKLDEKYRIKIDVNENQVRCEVFLEDKGVRRIIETVSTSIQRAVLSATKKIINKN